MVTLQNKYRKNIIKNIKLYRKKLNLTQEELSEKLEIHPVSLARLECGQRDVSLKILLKLAEIFNIEPGKLFE